MESQTIFLQKKTKILQLMMAIIMMRIQHISLKIPPHLMKMNMLLLVKSLKNQPKRLKKLGAESFNYSTRKNNKYVATLSNGKKIHFGSSQYPDFLIHKDKERKERHLTRAKKIKNKQGELNYTNPESANFWSVNLLWPEK